jgi:acetyl esterase
MKSVNPELLVREDVAVSTQIITGVDGNDIKLFIHRPTNVTGPIPCVYHIHGGGMAVLTAADTTHANWRTMIAGRGVICVGVEFRNTAGSLGAHPFPAGLNDCWSGLNWLHYQRSELSISKIVVLGESGGGNLALALALRCKRETTLELLDGVFAQCPFISGIYACSDEAKIAAGLGSLVEFDGYLLDNESMCIDVRLYTPNDPDAFKTNSLAWPLAANVDELRDLPPHFIVVNELDPLRDEGLVYFRRLLRAGVSAASVTLQGTIHAAELNFPSQIPDITRLTVDQIVSFARSL